MSETPSLTVEQINQAVELANQGIPHFEYAIGLLYSRGTAEPHIQQNDKEAEKWFQKSADQGFPSAQYELGMIALERENHREAFDQFSAAASAEHPDATYYLALSYKNSWGVEEDSQKAVEWLSKAADLGQAEALCQIGEWHHIAGLGMKKKELCDKGIQQLQESSEQGIARASTMLAFIYKEGQGVDVDKEEAQKWFVIAAEQSDPEAYHQLGLSIAPDNIEQSIEYFKKGAELGHPNCQQVLSLYDLVADEQGRERQFEDATSEFYGRVKGGDPGAIGAQRVLVEFTIASILGEFHDPQQDIGYEEALPSFQRAIQNGKKEAYMFLYEMRNLEAQSSEGDGIGVGFNFVKKADEVLSQYPNNPPFSPLELNA